MSECKEGYIKRKGYITSKGTVVKPACIKSTSMYGIKSSDVTTPLINKMLRKQHIAEIKTENKSPTKCPDGTIRRSAYIRSSHDKQVAVPASCIKEQGSHTGIPGLYNPKTGERVYVVLDDEKLGKYGYHDIKHKNAQQRHEALDKVYVAMNKNWLSLFRMLNYLAVVNKNHKTLHKILIADRNYIKKKYSLIIN
jgi:hypothetical protein